MSIGTAVYYHVWTPEEALLYNAKNQGCQKK